MGIYTSLLAEDTIKISFRPGNEPPVDGFVADNGKDFGKQGDLTFGWEKGCARAMQKKSTNENPVLSNGARFTTGAKWQIELPNGLYEVALCGGSGDDNLEAGLPVLVSGVPFFGDLKPDRNIFVKQYKSVEVKDGKLTMEIDPQRLSKDWDTKKRFVMIPFIEIKPVKQKIEERTLVWSVDSDANTDREFYGLVPDIRSVQRPETHPLDTLWYDCPAKIWDEGVVLGNGRLGTVVYGNPVQERIQMNEDTLWNGSPELPFANPDGKKYIDEARQMMFENKPVGDVWKFIYDKVFKREDGKFGPFMFDYLNGGDMILTFANGRFDKYYRSLDLADGIATTHYVKDGVTYQREAFTSAVSNVLVLRFTADKPGNISFNTLARDWYGAKISTEGNDTILVDGQAPAKNGLPGAIRYQKRLKIMSDGGTVTADGKTLTVKDANSVTMLVSIRTNFVNYKDVSADPVTRTKQDIANAEKKSYQELRAEHVADWHKFYDRMDIDLGKATTLELPTNERIRQFRESNDPQMVSLVLKFGRYLMIACSRPGSQAANLQGIWSAGYTGAWGGKYTVNINIQMIYWLAEPGNLSECHLPFMDLIKGDADIGQSTAKAYYDARGWVVHHNTDIWRYGHPIDGTAGMWPMAGPWYCDHIWEHYEYTLDKEFLKNMYPELRDCAIFYLDYLVKDPRNGYMVSAPSFSPENGNICVAPTMDVQLMNSVFAKAAAAAKILGVDEDLQKQWLVMKAKLPPMKIGKWGQLQEWTLEDIDDPNNHNRHVSHLYGLHPDNQITPWGTPDLFKASKVSLLARGDEATGWSLGWKVNFWARLRDGDHAYQILKLLIKPSYQADKLRWGSGLYPNFFDAHPPFQIDGNFGAAAGILEMLLQSQNGELDLLPALPSEWKTGSVHGMRVRGDMTVDLTWKDGKLDMLKIMPDRDRTVKVRLGEQVKEFKTVKGKALTLNGSLMAQ